MKSIVGRLAPIAFGNWGRFITSGAFNTLATYLLYLALLRRLPYQVSFSIAYASGIALAYFMNRYLVFRQPGGRAAPLLVALIYVGQYFLNLAVVSASVHWFSVRPALAPLIAIALTLPITYQLNQRVFSARSAGSGPVPRPWMQASHPGTQRLVMAVLIGLPILSLTLNAIAWLRFGLDLPFFDDWRAYNTGDIDSLDLLYLFQAQNDTMTPIGRALDAIAQRLLDGNSIAYQLLSMMAVLGGLLLLQWKLLRSALGDPLRAAVCFVFTLFMLQPGSYWGRENLAYQQALPLVFILWALWLAATRPWRDRWNVPAIFALGVLAGFTYISGAFGALAAGLGLLCITLLYADHPGRLPTLRAAAALALAGAATSLVQVSYAILPFKGGTHISDKPMALPIEAKFWFFYLGKVGRSLLLPAGCPILSLVLVLLVTVLFAAVCVAIVWLARSSAKSLSDRERRVASVFGAVSAMVATYLLMVAAGRTNYSPPEVRTAIDFFSAGFPRFHFFWATLLWPWLVAGLIVLGDRWVTRDSARRMAHAVGSAAVMAVVLMMIGHGALAHSERYRLEISQRNATLECLMNQLQKGDVIHCAEFNLPDFTAAYLYARQIGASFVRYFPVLPLELGVDAPSPWFRLTRDGDRVQARNMLGGPQHSYQGGASPQLDIDVGNQAGMAGCAMLDVTGSIKAAQPDALTVFFRPLGQQEFTQASSVTQQIEPGPMPSRFGFRLESALGFEGTLRLDPVKSPQKFELGEVEVRCRLRSRHETVAPFFGIIGSTTASELHELEPIGDKPGRFRAGDGARIVLRSGHRYEMASCGLLELQAIYQADSDDVAQAFFRSRGTQGFSERASVKKAVTARSEPESLSFLFYSASGFEDEVRIDPVRHAQALRFVDVRLRCLRQARQFSGSRAYSLMSAPS